MNIGQLKKLIKDLPDDMEVVTDGSDHNYWASGASIVMAHKHKDASPYEAGYSQDGGDDPEMIKIFGNRVEVLWVGV